MQHNGNGHDSDSGNAPKPLYSDFHFHSKYSRAVSPQMTLEGLNEGARVKGLGLIGTGDFSHPTWFKELKTKLDPQGNGLYKLRTMPQSPVLYTITNEVATFWSTPQGTRNVHHVIHSPSLEVAEQLNDVFSKWGNLAADGRPMFAKTNGARLVEACMSVSKDILVYPAHAWTPWFGVLGSASGYDNVEACYEDQSKFVYALETGMSSDPAMNWRVSKLDRYTLLSNSDSHSNHPWRLGRECNAFNLPEPTYKRIFEAVRTGDAKTLMYTVETDPCYGKYHYDGHRLCNFSCNPAKSRELKGICPVCKRKMTIGVESRVEELADRPVGSTKPNAIPFKKVLPLHELIAAVFGSQVASKPVEREGSKLLARFGSELSVLLDVPRDELAKETLVEIADAIMLNRVGGVPVKPGFDGEYGVPQIGEAKNKAAKTSSAGKQAAAAESKPIGQKTLGEY